MRHDWIGNDRFDLIRKCDVEYFVVGEMYAYAGQTVKVPRNDPGMALKWPILVWSVFSVRMICHVGRCFAIACKCCSELVYCHNCSLLLVKWKWYNLISFAVSLILFTNKFKKSERDYSLHAPDDDMGRIAIKHVMANEIMIQALKKRI